jgi:hypothetical protein
MVEQINQQKTFLSTLRFEDATSGLHCIHIKGDNILVIIHELPNPQCRLLFPRFIETISSLSPLSQPSNHIFSTLDPARTPSI